MTAQHPVRPEGDARLDLDFEALLFDGAADRDELLEHADLAARENTSTRDARARGVASSRLVERQQARGCASASGRCTSRPDDVGRLRGVDDLAVDASGVVA
jgi:hypothetical protein